MLLHWYLGFCLYDLWNFAAIIDCSVKSNYTVTLQLLTRQLEPLTEQQLAGICNLQQSSQQAEDALSQGMEALQQSLAETLAGSLGPSGSSGKLGTLKNFIRQVGF